MSTGDIQNNVRKLIAELRQIKHEYRKINFDALINGEPSEFLPIIHFSLLDYSLTLASFLANKGYDFYGDTDLRFIEAVYKMLMQEFSYKPSLTKEQFLALGFAERKIITLTEIVKFARQKHESLSKTKKKPAKSKRAHIVSKNGYLDSTENTKIKSKSNAQVIEHSSKINDVVIVKHSGSRQLNQAAVLENNGKVGNSIDRQLEWPRAKKPQQYAAGNEWSNGESANSKATGADIQRSIGSKATKQCINFGSLDSIGTVPSLIMPAKPAPPPQPCVALTVTPLKDSFRNKLPVTDVFQQLQCTTTPETTNCCEIDEIPVNFKVVKHGLATADEVNNIEKQTNVQLSSKAVEYQLPHTGAEKQCTASSQITNMVTDASVSTVGICSRQACQKSADLLQQFQCQLDTLAASFKDVVLMNNDLSARVVLLETKTKLLEEKVDVLSDVKRQEGIDTSAGHPKLSADYQQAENGARCKENAAKSIGSSKRVDFASESSRRSISLDRDERHVNYSPEKYTDDDNSLPSDFSPIKIGKFYAVGEQSSSESQSSKDTAKKQNDVAAFSPLRYVDNSFMDEGTKNTVRSVQQRLEETIKMLESPTTTTTIT
eukprot:gene11997-13235_t